MVSHLKSIVENIVNQRGISLTSFQKDRIRDIERSFDNKKIDYAAALSKLRSEFSYHLKDDDYRSIEKSLKNAH